MDKFELQSSFQATGDQPVAIEGLVNGVNWGLREQTLLGVTGSGKTFTMANVIAKLNRPTLVLAHNKTLAAQLCSEFREFFPNNAVEYFISYYDYYQPEAYIAHTDTYIEKDSAVNEEIDRLRHSATSALFERRDVIVVSSVSCLYGLGDPIDYKSMVISLRVGQERPLDDILRKLTEIRYERNDLDFSRNKFRLRGDTLEIYPAYWSGRAIRVEFFGDEIDRITEINIVTGEVLRVLSYAAIYPATHYAVSNEKKEAAEKTPAETSAKEPRKEQSVNTAKAEQTEPARKEEQPTKPAMQKVVAETPAEQPVEHIKATSVVIAEAAIAEAENKAFPVVEVPQRNKLPIVAETAVKTVQPQQPAVGNVAEPDNGVTPEADNDVTPSQQKPRRK